MSATSDPLLAPSTWPVARLMGISPIQHPAWEAARSAILDRAAAGPVTVILVGESGTGKTWLLRELASSLGEHGFPTMLLMQGDLPMSLSPGAALLVDEASRMDPAMRADLLAQQHGIAILAHLDWTAPAPDRATDSDPVIIRIRPLEPDEIGPFVAEWLRRAPTPAPVTVEPDALSRLAVLTGGTVRLIVQLLGAATAMGKLAGQPVITAASIDDVAQLRIGGMTEPSEPSAPPSIAAAAPTPLPPALRPARRSLRRPALAISAIAASLVLGWALVPAPPHPAPTADATPPAPRLPALANATLAPAIPATAAPPGPADIETPALAAAPPPPQPATPDLDFANAAPPPAGANPMPALAVSLPPPPVSPVEPNPRLVATAEPPARLDVPALPDQPPPRPHGGPGLVLIAQRGDTLQNLYGHVYRDRQAPDFATVLAANPGPFKPGAILVFPEPPGGWGRAQR